MQNACQGSALDGCGGSPIALKRRVGIAVVVAVTLCSGSAVVRARSGGRIAGPSGGEVAGAAIGVGAAVAIVTVVAINHAHHSLTGCAFNGANGMKLKSGDAKVYSLEGDAANIKAGDKVKLHGSRVKKAKSADGDSTFTVERFSKDYGPCHADIAQSGTP